MNSNDNINSHINSLENLLDPSNLYCNEHKKLKKYYLRNEDFFLCEYDGYENSKNYCHFKEILTEFKDEVQKLKDAEVCQTEGVSLQTSEKLKTSVNIVFRQADDFTRFLANFQNGYIQELEKLTYINSEILKIKDILSHINFREDGSVNFINIGANEAKELKILTLANILVRRKMGSNDKEINYTQVFIEILHKFHLMLISLTRSGRTWVESSANEIYAELSSIEDSKFKGELNKEEIDRQIYFRDEVEHIINSFQSQINQRDLTIESLTNQNNFLNSTLNEKNSSIAQLNVSLNENLLIIQENNSNISYLTLTLEDLNSKYAKLLAEKNNLAEKYNKISFSYESLIIEFNAAKENLQKTVRLHVLQIEEVTLINKRLEVELSEERDKYKLLHAEYEKLKALYDNLIMDNDMVVSDANDKDEQIRRLVDKFDQTVSEYENERKRLLEIISNHENTFKHLNLSIEETTSKFDITLREERNNYNMLLIEIEKFKGEIKKLNQQNITVINETNNTINNLHISIRELEKNLHDSQNSGSLGWEKFTQEKDENNNLKKIALELENKIRELNAIISQLRQKLEISLSEINTLKIEIIELNKEKTILMESEEKLIEENNLLSDELEALKISHSELLIELKAQIKQNEILGLQLEELESRFKTESNKSEEITIIRSTKTTEFRSRMELIILSKEKLENDLIEKKNVIRHLNSELEILKAKYEASSNDIVAMKEQLKSIPVLEENLDLLGVKVDELSNLNKNLESNISHKDAIISQLEQELKNCANQNEEFSVVITQHKESISNLQNYESKMNSLENTRLEIEQLKKKIKEAEDLNKSTYRSGSQRRSRSIFNRSCVENLDKFGSVISDNQLTSEPQQINNIRTITFPNLENLVNANVIQKNIMKDGVFVVPHKPAIRIEETFIETHESIDGVFVIPHKPAIRIEETFIETYESTDGVFVIPHKPAIRIEETFIETYESTDGVFVVPHKPAIRIEETFIETYESTDGVFVVPHKPTTIVETITHSIKEHAESSEFIEDAVFAVPNKPETHSELHLSSKIQDEVFVVPHKPATNLQLHLSREVLIDQAQAQQISLWLEETLKKSNLGLIRIFIASEDGFSSEAFKSKCNGKTNTVTIAKTNFGKLIGGFTPIAWETPTEGTHVYEEDQSETCFLFSLTLNEKYPLKSGLRQFAVCNTQSYGPLFGGGSDLEIVDECNVNYNSFSGTDHTYMSKRQPEEFYGDKKYLVEDYEIYQVVQN